MELKELNINEQNELQKIKDKNLKYKTAVLGLFIAYNNIRDEDSNLNLFLLSTIETLIGKMVSFNKDDKKIDETDVQNILARISDPEQSKKLFDNLSDQNYLDELNSLLS